MAVGAVIGAGLVVTEARADSVADFYRNRQMTLVIGGDPGGDYDVNGRLVARHFGRHIPGRPTIVVQNMPGASSILAGNHVYRVAPQDGTVLALLENTLPLGSVLKRVKPEFDLEKFQWIGNARNEVSVILTSAASGVRTLDDARKIPIVMGATSPNALNALYPKLMNQIFGTLFRVVTGYQSPPAIDFALERGEVGGRAGATWYGDHDRHFEQIQNGKLNLLVQVGMQKAADLPTLPSWVDLARSDDDRALLTLFSSPAAIGKPFVVGPKVPANIVAALRAAYQEMMVDPRFLRDADELGIPITPMDGATLAALVSSVFGTPDRLAERARKATE